MPTKQNNPQERKPTASALNDAIKQLGPPSRLLSERTQSKLQQVLGRRGASNADVAAALKKAGWTEPMPTHTMGGHSPFTLGISRMWMLTELLNSLYLPVDDPAFYVPPSRRYISGQVWGHGQALKETGILRANQYADITQSSIVSTAGLYSQIFTTPSDYGQVSQGSLGPDISWNATGTIGINPPWGSKVFGSATIIGRLWLAAYEFNVATSTFEEVIAVPHVLFNEADSGLVVRPFTHAGSFSPDSIPLRYILSPARTYWLGVLIEVEVRQNFQSDDRNHPTVPTPSITELNVFAFLSANVPAMWIDHKKLA